MSWSLIRFDIHELSSLIASVSLCRRFARWSDLFWSGLRGVTTPHLTPVKYLMLCNLDLYWQIRDLLVAPYLQAFPPHCLRFHILGRNPGIGLWLTMFDCIVPFCTSARGSSSRCVCGCGDPAYTFRYNPSRP